MHVDHRTIDDLEMRFLVSFGILYLLIANQLHRSVYDFKETEQLLISGRADTL